MITYVVPCGGSKLDRPAPARELYTGQMFRHTLASALRSAELDTAAGMPARVVIMSALHGLIGLDDVIAPYDLKMGAPGSVTPQQLAGQAAALGIGWDDPDDETERDSDVYALLPRAYYAVLHEALRGRYVYAQDVYEACSGIGEQRRVNAHVGRPVTDPAVADGPGPTVWIGGDVSAFWWGVPILVSYGRLRDVKTLPVASAPWVCDSRGFTELAQHGTWTIPAGQYAADLERYAAEIGRLTWAAPQDWPCTPDLLAKTGLTEEEHQRRTVASVVALRARVRSVPVIAVVLGLDAAGYLRHLAMYAAAGIDLRAEDAVVGVGSLVGRAPQEAADIIRTLHAAGLHRLHGFGVKGPVLDQVGPLLESVDSADWSGEARRTSGPCPHGLVAWERNCPHAAQQWAHAQRARAADVPVQEMLALYA